MSFSFVVPGKKKLLSTTCGRPNWGFNSIGCPQGTSGFPGALGEKVSGNRTFAIFSSRTHLARITKWLMIEWLTCFYTLCCTTRPASPSYVFNFYIWHIKDFTFNGANAFEVNWKMYTYQ